MSDFAMPLVLKEYIDPHTLIGLWEIRESADDMLKSIGLRMEERSLYEGFRTEERRQHWLSYRLLVRELTLPETYEIHYDNSGKPYLAGSSYHISVSHTEQLSTVILRDRHSVGIDIEKVRPRIIRVKDKFLSKAELDSLTPGDEISQLTLFWCAKEALYKICDKEGISIRNNITIEPFRIKDSGELRGKVHSEKIKESFDLFYTRYDNYAIVWTKKRIL